MAVSDHPAPPIELPAALGPIAADLLRALNRLNAHHAMEADLWRDRRDAVAAAIDPLDYRCDTAGDQLIRLDESAAAIRVARAQLCRRSQPLREALSGVVPTASPPLTSSPPELRTGAEPEWPQRLHLLQSTLSWTAGATTSAATAGYGPAYALASWPRPLGDPVRAGAGLARDDLETFPALVLACL